MTDKERITTLEGIIRNALSDHGDETHPWSCSSAMQLIELPDGTFDTVPSEETCDCWMADAREYLANQVVRPEPVNAQNCVCKHKPTDHAAGGRGLCSRVGCECMKFKE